MLVSVNTCYNLTEVKNIYIMKFLQKFLSSKNKDEGQKEFKEIAKEAVEESDDILRYLEKYDEGEQKFEPSHLGPLKKYL